MQSFSHIVNFVTVKTLLEPMRPLVTCLQGRKMEVYMGFKKVDEVKNFLIIFLLEE